MNILHLDIKGDNIRIDNKTPILIDFGIAWELDPSKDNLVVNTRAMVGTPYTASQFNHQLHPLGKRDDVISIIYALLHVHLDKLPWAEDCYYDQNKQTMQTILEKKQEYQVK